MVGPMTVTFVSWLVRARRNSTSPARIGDVQRNGATTRGWVNLGGGVGSPVSSTVSGAAVRCFIVRYSPTSFVKFVTSPGSSVSIPSIA